ncbi:ATP-binding protein [Castellaniella sp.]|uniref:ATP-binding protein n=1 Tax=Castellaniella sp. TaxID=1955812 RepID=UPI002AFFC3CC|nr:ATP-binding protein [Castellaniella sp.]
MKHVIRFFSTMAGRLFLILVLGMSAAAVLATVLAAVKRQQEAEHQNILRSADRLIAYVDLLDGSPAELRARLLDLGGPGIQPIGPDTPMLIPDPSFATVLSTQDARFAQARVAVIADRHCRPRLPDFVPSPDPESLADPGLVAPICRRIDIRLQDGTALTLALGSPPVIRSQALAADPVYLSLLLACIGLLAFAVARLASQPLRQLADAADELGHDLTRAPLALHGPLEVRRAAQAFNAMQERLRRHLAERTHMLAAISHDLQTPLTRLRLRLENVGDARMRELLIADLAAMNALVREGLDLARSATSTEQPVALDLDSLLESIVEDAVEAGGDVVFEQRCGAVLMLRPLSTHRLFMNLIDNALKYGHQARIRAQPDASSITVTVRDAGPGLPDDALERVFEPFVRLETSRSRQTGGAGLGLTIARALAANEGATLELRNRPEGGLEARVQWTARPLYVKR